ncbi:MAG: LysR family transcriptional regulator [Planctomycetota bacterium]
MPASPLDSTVDLSTRQMRMFCAVYRLRSYAAAGREAGLSTSAAWEQVKEIQKVYGVDLFSRRGRQVEPTAAGERLHELLQPLIAGIDSTRKALLDTQESQPSRVTIASAVRMMLEEVSIALREFRRLHPEVTVTVLQCDAGDAQRIVDEGHADVALTLEPGPGYAGDHVDLEPAYAIDYLLVAPARHELGAKRAVRLSDLTRYPLILPNEGSYSRHVLDQALHRQGIDAKLDVAVETANSAFTLACVRAGLGVGVVAGRGDGPLCKGLVVRSLRRLLGRARIVFVWKRGVIVPPTLRSLAETIRSEQALSRG